jgi:ABC-type glycerol-3-phosphate transport system substrate-binding protein
VTRALAVTALAIGLGIAGCGGDESGETTTTAPTVSIPPITSPIPATTTAPATTTTPTESTTTTRGNGNNVNPKQPDSETNDVPPPPGSPQEAFEKQCEQNPQACG